MGVFLESWEGEGLSGRCRYVDAALGKVVFIIEDEGECGIAVDKEIYSFIIM